MKKHSNFLKMNEDVLTLLEYYTTSDTELLSESNMLQPLVLQTRRYTLYLCSL